MIRPEIPLASSADRAMSASVSLAGPDRPHLGPPPTPTDPTALFELSLGGPQLLPALCWRGAGLQLGNASTCL